MPKKIIAVLLSVLVIVTAFALPTFASEDTEETSFIYSDYPTANLVSYPYDGYTNVQGFYSVQDDFGISINGVATAKHLYYCVRGQSIPAGTYTISLSVAGNATKNIRFEATVITNGVYSYHAVYAVDGEWSSCTFTVSEDSTISLYLFSIASDEVLDLQVYPMMNVGEVAYPFSPYMPYVLEQQYNNGYASGEAAGSTSGYDKGYAEGNVAGIIQGTEEGYKTGYQAGLDASAQSMNPFAMPFSIIVSPNVGYVVDGVTYYYETAFTLDNSFVYQSDYSLDFSRLVTTARNVAYNKVISSNSSASSITYGYFGFKFIWDKSGEETGSFYFDDYSVCSFSSVVSGLPSSITLAGYVDDEWDGYSIYPTSTYSYSLPSDAELSSFSCVSMAFNVPSSFSSNSVLLYANSSVSSPTYMSGYNQGYFDGAKDGLGDQADLYFDSGYNVGFSDGKKEGLSIAETGDWRNLMLAVTEAPINTFQSLFNFQVLGMDMRAAFGSILALCVVLIIVKKAVGL